jgi:DNA-binding beta-propeller fold protein YncE
LIYFVGPGNLKWSTTGKTVLGGKGYGSGPDQLKYADGLFIEPKTQILYVADAANNRVQKLYPNGKIRTAAGSPDGQGGSTSDKLTSPSGVFADENENVYVADLHNQRIQLWAKNAKSGKMVAGNSSTGSALNEFNTPIRVLLDSKKNLIVADMQNERVIRWSLPYDPAKSVGTIIAVSLGFIFVERGDSILNFCSKMRPIQHERI